MFTWAKCPHFGSSGFMCWSNLKKANLLPARFLDLFEQCLDPNCRAGWSLWDGEFTAAKHEVAEAIQPFVLAEAAALGSSPWLQSSRPRSRPPRDTLSHDFLSPLCGSTLPLTVENMIIKHEDYDPFRIVEAFEPAAAASAISAVLPEPLVASAVESPAGFPPWAAAHAEKKDLEQYVHHGGSAEKLHDPLWWRSQRCDSRSLWPAGWSPEAQGLEVCFRLDSVF